MSKNTKPNAEAHNEKEKKPVKMGLGQFSWRVDEVQSKNLGFNKSIEIKKKKRKEKGF